MGFLHPGLFRILYGRSYSEPLLYHEGKTENVVLSEVKDIDDEKARKYSTLIPKKATCKKKLEDFLLNKGADQLTIDSVISRFPDAITRRCNDLPEVWKLWENVLNTDEAVLAIIKRSPESFFRSGGVDKLSENISFLKSLGLSQKILHQLMEKSPRTFSNSVQLNKQKVVFFRELCVSLGGEDPDTFVRQVITNNIFILTRSTKRMQANIESIQSLLNLRDKHLLSWLKGEASCILNICNMYLTENILHIQQTMQSLGCLEADVTQYICENHSVLLLSPKIFTCKINLLLDCGADPKKILDTPLLLEVSLSSLRDKIKSLKQVNYDFKKKGLHVLVLYQSKFASRLERLSNLSKAEKQS
uniref:Uncharacterized protein n=2 Tax=Pyxicephalus adspersus TaxID=30357 RepID=A0AAV3AD79_PYXAD|nr:TPA: hypothetical protein GDO54_012775 [Pyxicephalus adspersus]